MEKWQKEYITENFPNLINDISCNVALLSHLCKLGVLADGDVQKVNARGTNEGDQEKVYALLQILPTRSSAYEHLAKALYDGKQTGALLTLLYGVEINIPNQNPFQFCGIEINPDDVLCKPVSFQGCRLPLNDICIPINTVRLQNVVRDHLNVSLYKEFLGDLNVTIATDTIPKALPYFIPRSLSMNSEVDSAIFEKRKEDIFLVEGIELFHLSRLAKNIKNAEIDRSSNQVYRLTAQFILLEHHDHFPDIVRQTKKLVHWLTYNNGSYVYIKSGSGEGIKVIKSFLKATNEKIISQHEFAQMCLESTTRNPILIYDSPGMGKSVLLSQLARDIKFKESDRNVIFLPFPQFIRQVIPTPQSPIHATAIKQAILRFSTVNKFGHEIMQELLDTGNHQIELFLDAFDEIPESDLDAAQTILNCISKQLNNVRVFITTRPHLSSKLEEAFGVLGFNIQPFDETNKNSFFIKYWENKHDVVATEQIKLFAQSCLKTLTSEMSGEDGNIAGIPLQCQMLAEIYAPDAKRGGLMTTTSQFRIDSAFKMYDEYIKMKFATVIDVNEREILQNFHIQQARNTLFLDDEASIKTYDGFHDAIYKIGIMKPNKSDSGVPEFVHRTLAEFFVAEQIAEATFGTFKQEETYEKFFDLFFGQALAVGIDDTEIFVTEDSDLWISIFSYPVVAHFLNCIITYKYANKQISKDLSIALKESVYYTSDIFCALINATLRSSLSSLFTLLLDLFLDIHHSTDGKINEFSFMHDISQSSTWESENSSKFKLLSSIQQVKDLNEIVQTAVKCSSLDLVRAACNLLLSLSGKQFHEFAFEENDIRRYLYIPPIQLAAERGHYLIFKYLFEFHKDSILDEATFLKCINFSARTTPAVVKDKLEILKEIVDKNPSILNNDPLVSRIVYAVHYDLIHYLIEAGVNVKAKDEHKNNITHVVGTFFSPEEYAKFLDLMISKNHKRLFLKRNSSRCTAFHVALKYIELKTDTLEIIAKQFNVDYNDRLTSAGSELACAIEGGRSRRVLEDIVRLGGKWKNMYDCGWGISDVISFSVETRNEDAVKHFISIGADVNKRHRFNLQTPLGTALDYDLIETAQILVESGADVNAPFLPQPDFDGLRLTTRMVSPINFVRNQAKSQTMVAMLEKSGAKRATIKSACANICAFCSCWPCYLYFCCTNCYYEIDLEYC